MAIISINNKHININNLVAYGCSFTAGDELYDTLIHPKADNIKRKKGIGYWKENIGTLEKRVELKLIKQEKASAWPGQLAKLLNIPVVNNAIGGFSLDTAILKFEEEFYSGNIDTNTLVVFGLTNPWRVSYFYNNEVKNILLGSIPNNLNSNTVCTVFSNDLLLVNYYNSIQRLLYFANQHNLNIYLIPMTNTIDRYLIDFERENNYVYEGTIQLLKYKLQDLMNSPFIEHTHYLYKYCNGEKDQHGGNHPRIHVHETFAHQIKNRLTMFT